MKNLISILGLSLSLGLNAFSQKDIRDMTFEERIFNRIECNRTFGKCYFPEYVLHDEKSKNGEEYVIAYYDFDHNNNPEVVACFKNNPNDKRNCRPYKTEDNAKVVMVDSNGDGLFDWVYSDLDNDGFLEHKDIFYEIPEIEKDSIEIRDVEDIPNRT